MAKSKVRKSRRLSEARVDEAISAFQETLPSFCETVLSSGSRSGNEWQVPDLDNSPRDGKPGSCCVNLETGCFYDHNPEAEPQSGGPVNLWTALFGVTDFGEIILGMEAWVKDGLLPDGSKGAAAKKALEVSKEETLVARDVEEKKIIEGINQLKKNQAWVQAHCVQPKGVYTAHGYTFTPGDPLGRNEMTGAATITWEEYHQQFYRDWYDELIRYEMSQLFAWRWDKAVTETKKQKEEVSAIFAEYRGLNKEVFGWLIDQGLIAIYSSERINNRTGETWESIEIAFPVSQRILTPPFDVPRDSWKKGDWWWIGQEFLGMHIKWFAANGESLWRYEPKGNRLGSVPFIIGDLAAADGVVIGESTWDIVAFIELGKLYERGPDRPWVTIATRGAGDAKRIPVSQIKPDATILLLLQNDRANERWYDGLPLEIRKRGRLIIPPTGIKDLNDWMQKLPTEEIRKSLGFKK